MRVLTVRNPWAWALIHGGKTVENRPRNIVGEYRGPVAIHAGLAWDDRWGQHPTAPAMFRAIAAERVRTGRGLVEIRQRMLNRRGEILGVVDLVAVHDGRECETDDHAACSEWAMQGHIHLELRDPRPIDAQIQFRGNLGLQTLDDETTARVLEAIA